MPVKAFRVLLWVAIPLAVIMHLLHEWTNHQYPMLWFGITMSVVMVLSGYLIYKSDDWLLEEAEQIKRRRALNEPKPEPSSNPYQSVQNER